MGSHNSYVALSPLFEFWEFLEVWWGHGPFVIIISMYLCRNPSLGLVTKARGCKVASQEGSLGIMPHAHSSARKYEGIDPHAPKGTPTLGVGVLVDSRMSKKQLQGSKPNGLRSSLYHWKAIESQMSKMGSHDPLDIWNTSYGQKKGRKSNW